MGNQRTWSNLGSEEAKKALLKRGEQTLLTLLSSTQFDVLLLNGMSVIKGFECATGVTVSKVSGWGQRVGGCFGGGLDAS